MTIEPGPNKKKQGFHQLCFAFCEIDCAMIHSEICAGAKARDWVWDLDWDTSSARFKRRSSVPASSQRKRR